MIASGGLHSLKDVEASAQKLEPEGIIGVITGRAIYEGTIDFKKAQAAADKATERPHRPRRRQGLTWASPSASFPASTSPRAASSRA